MMNLSQTKLLSLTMQLELKTREFKELNKKLETMKKNSINPNDKKLLNLKKLYTECYLEIVKINNDLAKIN